MQVQSDTTNLGFWNLVLDGCKEILVVLREREKQKLGDKRPQNDIDYAMWMFVKTRAGGKLDLKQRGRGQMNWKVFDGLLGIRSPDDRINLWLQTRVPKW